MKKDNTHPLPEVSDEVMVEKSSEVFYNYQEEIDRLIVHYEFLKRFSRTLGHMNKGKKKKECIEEMFKVLSKITEWETEGKLVA